MANPWIEGVYRKAGWNVVYSLHIVPRVFTISVSYIIFLGRVEMDVLPLKYDSDSQN